MEPLSQPFFFCKDMRANDTCIEIDIKGEYLRMHQESTIRLSTCHRRPSGAIPE